MGESILPGGVTGRASPSYPEGWQVGRVHPRGMGRWDQRLPFRHGGRGAGRVAKGSPSIPGGEGGAPGGGVEGWQVGCVQSSQRGDK